MYGNYDSETPTIKTINERIVQVQKKLIIMSNFFFISLIESISLNIVEVLISHTFIVKFISEVFEPVFTILSYIEELRSNISMSTSPTILAFLEHLVRTRICRYIVTY